ncbi:MAG TPA: type II toxin-antitoxin system VapC family toxin [Terriglobales bacterium]|nr:type II toxin-antitoxin system VapC family toxin [Terriglobales bacterium]
MKVAAIKRLVLDASVAVAWCFEDESAPLAESVLDLLSAGAETLVPAIWPLEVANALLVAERRKRITTAQVTGLLQRISKLPITVESMPPAHAFEQVLSVARQRELSEYDASYVELALREGLPLATLDAKLRRAARSAGIALVE